jgi:aspartate beta-hydroxylase
VSPSPINVPAITAAGFSALRGGDPEAARGLFDQAVAAGAADVSVWFGLAGVHRSLGAAAQEGEALDRVLSLDAHHLPALIAKGDWYARQGDQRAADSYYVAAAKLAASMPSLSPEWRAELRRVEAASQSFAREYERHLLGALGATGLGGPGTERFAHAIDLLLGKRKIYYQQPKYFFYPELPHVQFFDRRLFPWVGAIEREFAAIRDEARKVLDAEIGFVPYVQRDPQRPSFDVRGLLDNPNWGAFFLIKDGATVSDNAARCPRTMAALAHVPLCRIDGRTPSVLFSLLRPGMRIPPHHGFMNTRMIGHLPLIVPPNCALRVGNDTRTWREGEVMLFDDSIEHEAWNLSGEPRIVLLFDTWRPELSAKEQELVAAMLSAIDGFGGPRRKWAD